VAEGSPGPREGTQLPDWTCKCGTFNALLPADSADCHRCKKLSVGTLCYYHKELSEGRKCHPTNHTCSDCWKHFKYSDPEYDQLGVMIREAKRALSFCSKTENYDHDFEDPREMRKDIRAIEKELATGKISKEDALERADEILWNACIHLDFRYCGGEIGFMLNLIDDIIEDLDDYAEYQEAKKEYKMERAEEIKKHPETFEIKSSDKKTTYLVNLERRYCSCPGFTNYDDCKHVNMPKPKNAKMVNQQEPKKTKPKAKKQRK
jgi:hypothetical protein